MHSLSTTRENQHPHLLSLLLRSQRSTPSLWGQYITKCGVRDQPVERPDVGVASEAVVRWYVIGRWWIDKWRSCTGHGSRLAGDAEVVTGGNRWEMFSWVRRRACRRLLASAQSATKERWGLAQRLAFLSSECVLQHLLLAAKLPQWP